MFKPGLLKSAGVSVLFVACMACAAHADMEGLPLLLSTSTVQAPRVDFAGEAASADARFAADWVAGNADNHGLPFVIVDKKMPRPLCSVQTASSRASHRFCWVLPWAMAA